MTPKRPFQEEELHAFVDGRLPDERRAELQRRIAEDPAMAQEISIWQEQARLLARATDFKLHETVPERLNVARLLEDRLAVPPARMPARHWMRYAAAACLVFALGTGGGWLAHGAFDPNPMRGRFDVEALTMHTVLMDPTTAIAAPRTGSPVALVSWLSGELGQPVRIADIASQGYDLLGAQVVPTPFGRSGLLFYASPQGRRLTLLVQPMPATGSLPMRPVQSGRMAGYTWIKHGMGYAMIEGGVSITNGAVPPYLRKAADYLCDGPSI